MTERSDDLDKPTSITHARYQVAFQRSGNSEAARRKMRHMRRRTALPPGFTPTKWSMAAPMRYGVGSKESDEYYIVPKDFAFDGASVPLLLTPFVPRTHSAYLGAAALHDYLYRERPDVPRARADAIFREAMLVLGLHWVWATILWRGVRAGGWMVWYRRQPETATGKFLHYGRLSYPFGAFWVFVLAILGFAIDVFNIPKYRKIADEIAEKDQP